MNSRMERYKEEPQVSSRVSKNQDLYSEINNQTLSRVRTNSNYRVLDDVPKEINVEDIKNYIDSLSEGREEKKRVVINSHSSETLDTPPEEPRVYDINSIIEDAKSKKESIYEEEKYKKLHNTELDILKKIEIYNQNKMKEELEDVKEDDKSLMDLINTLAMNKEQNDDLLSELTGGSENTIVTKPIQEELEDAVKEKEQNEPTKEVENKLPSVDKSFYTNSVNFSKQDFEDLDKLEKEVSKTSALLVFGIIFIVLFVAATVFIVLKYVVGIELF